MLILVKKIVFQKKNNNNDTQNIKKNQYIHKIVYSDLNNKNKSICKDNNKKERPCSFSKLTDIIKKIYFQVQKRQF